MLHNAMHWFSFTTVMSLSQVHLLKSSSLQTRTEWLKTTATHWHWWIIKVYLQLEVYGAGTWFW